MRPLQAWSVAGERGQMFENHATADRPMLEVCARSWAMALCKEGNKNPKFFIPYFLKNPNQQFLKTLSLCIIAQLLLALSYRVFEKCDSHHIGLLPSVCSSPFLLL